MATSLSTARAVLQALFNLVGVTTAMGDAGDTDQSKRTYVNTLLGLLKAGQSYHVTTAQAVTVITALRAAMVGNSDVPAYQISVVNGLAGVLLGTSVSCTVLQAQAILAAIKYAAEAQNDTYNVQQSKVNTLITLLLAL